MPQSMIKIVIFNVWTLYLNIMFGADSSAEHYYHEDSDLNLPHNVTDDDTKDEEPNYDVYDVPPEFHEEIMDPKYNILNVSLDKLGDYFEQYITFYKFADDYGVGIPGKRNRDKDFANFEENVRRSIRMNTMKNGIYFGINEFTRMSFKEFTDKYTGFDSSKLEELDSPFFNKTKEPPVKVDWTPEPDGAPRHMDGVCKTSHVFSVMSAIEYQVNKKYSTGPFALSVQQGFNCDPYSTCKGSGKPHNVIAGLMKLQGVSRFADYTNGITDESVTNKSTCSLLPDPLVRVVKVVNLIVENEVELAAAVAEYGAFVTAMYVSQEVKNYCGGVLDPLDCDHEPNHSVVLVGYGVDEDKTPYWLIKNSWGPYWGENGNIRLIRGKEACGIGVYLATADVELLHPPTPVTETTAAAPTKSVFQHIHTKKSPDKNIVRFRNFETSPRVEKRASPTPKIATTLRKVNSVGLMHTSNGKATKIHNTNISSKSKKSTTQTTKHISTTGTNESLFRSRPPGKSNDIKKRTNDKRIYDNTTFADNWSVSLHGFKSNNVGSTTFNSDKIPIMDVIINQMQAKKRNSTTVPTIINAKTGTPLKTTHSIEVLTNQPSNNVVAKNRSIILSKTTTKKKISVSWHFKPMTQISPTQTEKITAQTRSAIILKRAFQGGKEIFSSDEQLKPKQTSVSEKSKYSWGQMKTSSKSVNTESLGRKKLLVKRRKLLQTTTERTTTALTLSETDDSVSTDYIEQLHNLTNFRSWLDKGETFF